MPGKSSNRSARADRPRGGIPKRRRTVETGGLGGASDASSGGGAGSGIPGGGTDMRTNPKPVTDADIERDRKKLFPEAKTRRRSGKR